MQEKMEGGTPQGFLWPVTGQLYMLCGPTQALPELRRGTAILTLLLLLCSGQTLNLPILMLHILPCKAL